jgi:hypothetical protein
MDQWDNTLNIIKEASIRIQEKINTYMDEKIDPFIIINAITFNQVETNCINEDQVVESILNSLKNKKINLPVEIKDYIFSISCLETKYDLVYEHINKIQQLNPNLLSEVIDNALSEYKRINNFYISQDIELYIDELIPIIINKCQNFLDIKCYF